MFPPVGNPLRRKENKTQPAPKEEKLLNKKVHPGKVARPKKRPIDPGAALVSKKTPAQARICPDHSGRVQILNWNRSLGSKSAKENSTRQEIQWSLKAKRIVALGNKQKLMLLGATSERHCRAASRKWHWTHRLPWAMNTLSTMHNDNVLHTPAHKQQSGTPNERPRSGHLEQSQDG